MYESATWDHQPPLFLRRKRNCSHLGLGVGASGELRSQTQMKRIIKVTRVNTPRVL